MGKARRRGLGLTAKRDLGLTWLSLWVETLLGSHLRFSLLVPFFILKAKFPENW